MTTSEVVELGFAGACWLGFAVVGFWFCDRWLCRSYEIRKLSIPIQFSVVFALSLSFFTLIIFELLNFLQRNTRWVAWKMSLFTMVIYILLVLPFHQCLLILDQLMPKTSRVKKALIALFFSGSILAAFWRISDPIISPDRQSFTLWSHPLELSISRIGMLGVALMSVLSGFGVVNFPLNNLRYFMRNVKDSEIATCAQQLHSTFTQITQKQKELLSSQQNKEKSSGIWNWVTTRFSTSSDVDLQQQIEALREFQSELFLEYVELRQERDRTLHSRTLLGRSQGFIAYFFSVFCVIKLFLTMYSIVMNKSANADPVTKFLGFILPLLDIQIDEAFWSQYISFVFVGLLVAFSVRGFLDRLMKIFRTMASNATSGIIVLFLAQLTGVYFTSSVLLMRMNLPPQFREIVTEVIGDVEFGFYHKWFDYIFVPSALLTVLLFFLRRTIGSRMRDSHLDKHF